MAKSFIQLLTLLLILMFAGTANAEIYQCGSAFYDDTTLNRNDCTPLRSSSVCGSDGNRYISPSKHSLPVLNQSCKSTSKQAARSPFLVVEEGKTRPSPARRINQKRSSYKSEPNGFKESLNELFKVFQCAGDAFDGDMNQEACSKLVTPGLAIPVE
jgi:hypothetical protein